MSAAMIAAILDWAAKNWRLLLIPLAVLIVLAAALYGAHLYGKVDALSRQLAAAQSVNASNRREIETIRANAASAARAVAADAAATIARTDAVAAIKRDIAHATLSRPTASLLEAKASKDTCTTVGPGLRAALDGLRKLQAGNAHPD